MIQCVRIEHPGDGNGLWTSTGNNSSRHDYLIHRLDCYIELKEKHLNMPPPQADLPISDTFINASIEWDLGDVPNPYHCAFKSIEQMKEWVTDSQLKEITDAGFKIYYIETTEGIEGNHQIIFKKTNTKYTDITNIFL
jgi:hypothetical protein